MLLRHTDYMSFELPDMPYAYDALEPHIDALTMEIHHTKHHNAYTSNLNAVIEANGLDSIPIGELLAGGPGEQRSWTSGVSTDDIAAVRNNGGGWWNHCQFWHVMSAAGGGAPSGDLATAIESAFGSFDEFKSIFHKAAMTRFGSGWVWLGVKDDSGFAVAHPGGLCVCSTPNQDNPLMDGSCDPILGLDVWEHAYYKKYGPGRATYIDAWWDVVDWGEVSRRYDEALSNLGTGNVSTLF